MPIQGIYKGSSNYKLPPLSIQRFQSVNPITIHVQGSLKDLSKHNKDQFSYHNQLTSKELHQAMDTKITTIIITSGCFKK